MIVVLTFFIYNAFFWGEGTCQFLMVTEYQLPYMTVYLQLFFSLLHNSVYEIICLVASVCLIVCALML